MEQTPLTWHLIDQIAGELGATVATRRKWRQEGRGVPSAWRIRIAEAQMACGKPIALGDFEKLEANPGRIAA